MIIRYLLFLLPLLAGCSFPKDPEDSLQKAREHGLEVGIVHHPPFTMYENGKASGIEVEILEDFAQKEGLKINYTYGTETTLVKQLEEYRLHLIIGGFEKKTVWKDKAGLTTKYNDKNCMFIAKGENALLYRLESHLLKHMKNGN